MRDDYNNSALAKMAEGMLQEMEKASNHPVIGEIWIYKGQEVKITDGSFRGELFGKPYGISNCWGFQYLNTGKRGSDYDNNREVFYRKPKQ